MDGLPEARSDHTERCGSGHISGYPLGLFAGNAGQAKPPRSSSASGTALRPAFLLVLRPAPVRSALTFQQRDNQTGRTELCLVSSGAAGLSSHSELALRVAQQESTGSVSRTAAAA